MLILTNKAEVDVAVKAKAVPAYLGLHIIEILEGLDSVYGVRTFPLLEDGGYVAVLQGPDDLKQEDVRDDLAALDVVTYRNQDNYFNVFVLRQNDFGITYFVPDQEWLPDETRNHLCNAAGLSGLKRPNSSS
jgi:hypothetical protein